MIRVQETTNGFEVTLDPDKDDSLEYRDLTEGSPGGHGSIVDGHPDHSVGKALSEIYRWDRDSKLGRSRSQERPDYVVYPLGGDIIKVLDERSGSQEVFRRNDPVQYTIHYEVAQEYFSARPLLLPWHNAEEYEIWALSLYADMNDKKVGKTSYMPYAVRRDGSVKFFESVPIGQVKRPLNALEIADAYRVWPASTTE